MDFENKIPESKHAFYHLEICCRYVGERYGHPNISEWTNGDYIKLSGLLSRQTEVHISPNTLKRIFGKLKTTERYFPQKATRDTLARYTGYKDWELFVQQHPRPDFHLSEIISKAPVPVIVAEQTPAPAIIKKRNWRPLVAALSIIAIVVLVIMFLYGDRTSESVFEGVKLTCSNPEGTNPHSAIFKLQVPPDFRGDVNNFTIDFADGKASRPISDVKLITHYYEIPGRYYPVLKFNNLPVDTLAVYLKTVGWTATANMQYDSSRVFPLPAATLFKGEQMRVTTTEVFREGVDTSRTFYIHYVNAHPTGISGDNFEFNTRLSTSTERPGVRCSQVTISIFGHRSKHVVRIMKPGCSSFNGLQFSDNIISGESEDLSVLGKDLSGGGSIKMVVKDHQGTLWINGQQVYRADYKLAVGEIYGLEILFSGIGQVGDVAIKDLKSGNISQR